METKNENTEINGHDHATPKTPEPSPEARADTSQPPAKATLTAEVMRWQLFNVDGEWPPMNGVSHFDAEINEPAIFAHACAVKTGVLDLMNKPQIHVRMVFVICPDAPKRVKRFLVTPIGAIIGVRKNMPAPTFLGVVVNPLTGDPLGIWQVPEVEAQDAPTVPQTSNDLPPVVGEIDVKDPSDG